MFEVNQRVWRIAIAVCFDALRANAISGLTCLHLQLATHIFIKEMGVIQVNLLVLGVAIVTRFDMHGPMR